MSGLLSWLFVPKCAVCKKRLSANREILLCDECLLRWEREKQSDCPRICQIVTLREKKTGKLFRVFNVHLDHISEEARVLGMGAALEAIEKENQKLALPLFLLGDMNAYPESEAIKNAKSVLVDLTENSGATYHEFGHKEEEIDYIFTDTQTAKNPWQCTRVERMEHGIYLSDHYPVMVEGEI